MLNYSGNQMLHSAEMIFENRFHLLLGCSQKCVDFEVSQALKVKVYNIFSIVVTI